MNKIIFLIIGLFLFCGIEVRAQHTASSSVYVKINAVSNVAQIKFSNGFSQTGLINNNAVSGSTLVIPSGDSKVMPSSAIQNFATFSITSENKNSFSVSLPSHPVILENPKNGNTIQVNGSQSSSQTGKGEFKNKVWVVNLGALLRIGSVNDAPAGEYSGNYPVTLVYN